MGTSAKVRVGFCLAHSGTPTMPHAGFHALGKHMSRARRWWLEKQLKSAAANPNIPLLGAGCARQSVCECRHHELDWWTRPDQRINVKLVQAAFPMLGCFNAASSSQPIRLVFSDASTRMWCPNLEQSLLLNFSLGPGSASRLVALFQVLVSLVAGFKFSVIERFLIEKFYCPNSTGLQLACFTVSHCICPRICRAWKCRCSMNTVNAGHTVVEPPGGHEVMGTRFNFLIHSNVAAVVIICMSLCTCCASHGIVQWLKLADTRFDLP